MMEDNLQTKETVAYSKLKNMILEGKFPRDQFLSQRMLATKVNTNISTIRTVLRLLESDNLIENVPQWGVRIPIETEDVIKDRYFIRELLEVGAVQRIIKLRDLKDFDSQAIIDKARYCDELAKDVTKNIESFSKAHFDFHMELAKQSGSPLLLTSLSRIHFRSLILSHAQRGWALGASINHETLVNAILHCEEKEAIEKTINHIRGGLQSELDAMRSTKI